MAGLAGDASPCFGKERAMKLNNLDRLHQAKDLVKLAYTIAYLEDKVIFVSYGFELIKKETLA